MKFIDNVCLNVSMLKYLISSLLCLVCDLWKETTNAKKVTILKLIQKLIHD